MIQRARRSLRLRLPRGDSCSGQRPPACALSLSAAILLPMSVDRLDLASVFVGNWDLRDANTRIPLQPCPATTPNDNATPYTAALLLVPSSSGASARFLPSPGITPILIPSDSSFLSVP